MIELARSRVNSGELARTFYERKMGNRFENPMNYVEWSKSVELARTLTPNSSLRHGRRMEEKIFEQKLRKATKGRRWQLAGRLFSTPFVDC